MQVMDITPEISTNNTHLLIVNNQVVFRVDAEKGTVLHGNL